jgi:hypothetical protein
MAQIAIRVAKKHRFPLFSPVYKPAIPTGPTSKQWLGNPEKRKPKKGNR